MSAKHDVTIVYPNDEQRLVAVPLGETSDGVLYRLFPGVQLEDQVVEYAYQKRVNGVNYIYEADEDGNVVEPMNLTVLPPSREPDDFFPFEFVGYELEEQS